MKSLLGRVFSVPRWASFPASAAIAVGLTAAVYPGGLSAAYADLRDAGEATAAVEQCRTTERRLGDQLTDIRERMEYKDELVTALIRGEATLAAVTAEFVALHRNQEVGLGLQRLRYGPLPDDELAACNVLELVRLRLGAEGGSSVVLNRLRAEYERHFGHRPRVG